MKEYIDKLNYLINHQHHICPVCKHIMTLSQPLDLHHKSRQHSWRRKKYPKFIDSLLNLEVLHSGCHLSKDGSHISDLQAKKWERFLMRHEKCEKIVNMDLTTLV